jgi:predicted DNA-binding transcriptional regulator YafY
MDKNQFARYKKYDAIYRNFGIERTKAELLLELEVSEKTFNLDRRAMEAEFGVEIVAKKGKKGFIYQYAEPDMSMMERPLSQEEVDKIEQAIAILSGISGLELFEGFEEILTNLRGFESKTKMIDQMEPFVSFQTDNWGNTKNFDTLFNSIRDKQVLEIVYKDFKGEVYTFEIHPYFLKHYNEMWYLFGYNKMEHIYDWVLPLDRIEDIRFLDVQYKKNEAFDFDGDYFKDIVGVTKDFNVQPVTIKIRVKPESVGFVNSKPLNPFQKPVAKGNDGHCYTYLTVRPNKELYNRLLMFGDAVEVVEPIEIRENIRAIIDNIKNKYRK